MSSPSESTQKTSALAGICHDQLAAQQIYFQAKDSAAIEALPAADAAAVQRYGGAAADHWRSGQGLRQQLHRRTPEDGCRRQDVLSDECGGAGQPAGSEASGAGADSLPG
jgi:hypothetical protein